MDGTIQYLNTDLDVASDEDLLPIVAALEAAGVHPLYLPPEGGRTGCVTFETDETFTEPEPNIKAMLDVIEALSPELKAAWSRCSQREFNIGYDCGREPWAFNQGLSAELLGRIAAAGACLRVTIYPDRG